MANYTVVLLEAVRSFDQFYTYRSTTPLRTGDRVLVPFGPKDEPKEAVVFGPAEEMTDIKPIIRHLSVQPLAESLVESLRWAENYYVAPVGALAKLALPKAVRFDVKLTYEVIDPTLEADTRQQIASNNISGKNLNQLVESGRIARVYSAERKGLATVRYFQRDNIDQLKAFQADLPARQTILHHVLSELQQKDKIPVAQNITSRHIEILAQGSGVRLVELPQPPTPNQPQFELPVLTTDQAAIAKELSSGTHLIYGIPASGKTTILMDRIRRTLDEGRQAVVLVAERLMAEQLTRRMMEHFTEPVATIHSQNNDTQIRHLYHYIARGDYKIIIGTRNAILAPFDNLGLVAIDDFHDDAFYSDEPPVDFRRLAIEYAGRLSIPAVLISSTPDLTFLSDESIEKHYLASAFTDHKRIYQLIDMKTQMVGTANAWLSRPLEQAVKQKSLLFFNRIGYASLVLCRQCGQALSCPECHQPMMYHQTSKRLHCRLCGVSDSLPKACPACGSENFEFAGMGLEKLSELLRAKYPDKTIRQFDSHTLRKKSNLKKVDQWLASSDILLATQILTKGHDIGGLKVVGLLSPDTMLYTSEYRSREKSFQTMIQVAGRVGRDQTGEVYIQTYSPENDVYQRVIAEDITGFYRREYQLRRLHDLPPHSHMIKLIVSDKNLSDTEAYAEKLVHFLQVKFSYKIKGPYAPIFEKVGRYYRRQILIQDPSTMDDLKALLRSVKPRRSVRLQVVVDPLTTLY